ncbi:hypothetical protein SDRG_15773 [Saprolegnia diclina VS20]|uniref:Uncharacterized protein n=1 Tax=Saprolegnia diclina (strain VS20) TaxID=1156394 RepID=T0R323_SAPDV|nr:hypothetical protein SDRG_15773 [Saprolegnia diclina VS20]EQC26428.1 hypothetical protein SDRG_15773 [Saprolegnia diclina VS20]|eukprot:XP_008620177.1 hypothetical protein SDRG_15773 [Saprolegnia diclina VS20]
MTTHRGPGTPNTLDTFYEALVQSRPSKAALAAGHLSIGNKKFLLESVYAKPATPPPRRTPPDDTLDVLLLLQQSDGRWKLTDALSDCLYGAIPPVPPGVAPGMWATACALTVLRRQPEHYDRLEKACTLALAHVDSHVFECAKHTMPSVPLSIAPEVYIRGNTPVPQQPAVIDPDALSTKVLQDVPKKTRALLRRGCGAELDVHFANKRALSPYQAGEAIESCFRKSSQHLYAVPEVQDVWARAHVLYIHATKPPLYDLQYDHGAREKVVRVQGRYLRRPGVTRLETPKSMLEHVTTRWLTPVPVQDEVDRFSEAMRSHTMKPKWTVPPIHTQCSTSISVTRSEPLLRRRAPRPEDLPPERPRTLTPVEADVIASILQYEKVLACFLAKVDACSTLSARIFAEKIHAFDAFTQLAPAVVESTLACIEYVVALQDALAGPGAQHYVPFMWHGQPFLSTVLHQFDRLQARHDLVDWYGVDFYFECNPFLTATTVGCRKRSWTRDDVVQNSWWPETAYSPELRSAIAIGEERLLQHWRRSDDVHSWV